MKQRSGDVLIGIPSNMVQYAALQLLLCAITGYEPGEFVHYIVNAHIYENHMDAIEEVLSRGPRVLPTLEFGMNPTDFVPPVKHDIGTIHVLHGDLFTLRDYNPHPAITGIPVAI